MSNKPSSTIKRIKLLNTSIGRFRSIKDTSKVVDRIAKSLNNSFIDAPEKGEVLITQRVVSAGSTSFNQSFEIQHDLGYRPTKIILGSFFLLNSSGVAIDPTALLFSTRSSGPRSVIINLRMTSPVSTFTGTMNIYLR